MSWTVEHVNAGLGVFAAPRISEVETIERYTDLFVHNDLPKHALSMNQYDEVTIAVPMSAFNRCAKALPNRATYHRGLEHSC